MGKETSLFINSKRVGAISVALLIATVLSVTFTLGTLATFNHWKRLARVQLELSDCVGREIRKVQKTASSIQSTNRKMRKIRTMIVLSSKTPAIAASLRASLAPLSIHLNFQLARWNLNYGRWTLHAVCPGAKRSWYPRSPCLPQGADALGPRPCQWNPSKRNFKLWLKKETRIAHAETYKLTKKWKVRWRPPPITEAVANL